MDFDQFVEKLKDALQESNPDLDFSVSDVSKLQGESYTGISVTPKDSNMGASINVEPMYQKLQDGAEFSDIVSETEQIARSAINQMPSINEAELTDYSHMKDFLVMQVIPTVGNAEMLSTIPHKEMEDMSVVYRFQMESNESGSASILVTNAMLGNFGITAEQLAQDAAAIAPENNPAKVRNMSEVMAELSGGLFDMPPSPMWVATTETSVNGAGVIAYPDFMEQAAEQLGGDFYILPSSVHEVLLIADDGSMNAAQLSEMVSSINEAEVAPADRLSDVAYHYDAEEHIFEQAQAFEDRMAEREEMSQEPIEQTDMITVLMVQPGERPYETQIHTELEDLQSLVGGSIEVAYPFDDNVGLIMNEEGKIEGLPLNRALRDEDGDIYDIVAGPFMVVGLTEDNFGSLTKDQLKHYGEVFQQLEAFVKMGKSIMAIPIPEETLEARETAKVKVAEEIGAKPKHKKPEHDGH